MRNREVSPAGANSYSGLAWSVTLRPLERPPAGAGTPPAGAGTPPALLKLVGGPSGSFWYVGPRRKRQRGWQVTKLGRVRVAGDRRKGDASIDTLKASVVLTVREWRGRSRAEQREGVARCIEEDPRKQKLRRGSRPAKGKTDAGRTDRQLDKTLKARRCLQC